MEGYIGEIRLFGGNFAPRSWADCHGQLLPISSNSALFSILGTIYGGDGRTTLALPDLRGRVALHAGTGPGMPNYSLGQKGGTDKTQLIEANLPAHNHPGVFAVADGPGNSFGSNGNYIASKAKDVDANPNTTVEVYKTAATSTFLLGNTVNTGPSGSTGGGQAINNFPPYLAVRFIICINGIFPSRS